MQTPFQRSLRQVLLVLLLTEFAAAQPDFHQQVLQVSAETRLDWAYPILGRSPTKPPHALLNGYHSEGIKYDFFGPRASRDGGPFPLVIFVSPWDRRGGWTLWEDVCRANRLLYASPRDMGNGHPTEHRVRAVLDVLDDVRSRYPIDPDRTYLTGYSGGAFIAARTAFALPEYFGGVLCIGDAPEPPRELWRLARIRARLSVATICGDRDPVAPQLEHVSLPWLEGAGVRVESVLLRGTGHELPDTEWVEKAFTWLEEGIAERRRASAKQPALRIADAPSREEWAERVLRDAKSQLAPENDAELAAGLLQLEGLVERWSDTSAAESARTLLADYAQRTPRPWGAVRDADELKLLRLQAEGYERLAHDRRKTARQRQGSVAKYAIHLWEELQRRTNDPNLSKSASTRIASLTQVAIAAPEESNHFPLARLRFAMEGDVTLAEAIEHMRRALASVGYELQFDQEKLHSAGIDLEMMCHPRIKAGTFAEIDRKVFRRVGLRMHRDGGTVTLLPLAAE